MTERHSKAFLQATLNCFNDSILFFNRLKRKKKRCHGKIVINFCTIFVLSFFFERFSIEKLESKRGRDKKGWILLIAL